MSTLEHLHDLVTDMNLPFTRVVRVRGGLQSSYVFQNEQQLEHWKNEFFPALQQKYGADLTYKEDTLPGFKIGDTCGIYGEARDHFKIEKMVRYGNYRYGYALDSGWVEEVAKSFDVVGLERQEALDYNSTPSM